MKLRKNKLITLLFSLLLMFCDPVFAIGFFEDDENIIWKSGLNLYFKYVAQDSSKFGKNDHPVILDEKSINQALKSLEFIEKGFFLGETIRTVFQVSQVNLLSKQLAKGLKNAKSGQDIIFVMEGGSRKLILLNEKNFVAGRVFYKEGKLNIILGEYDKARNTEFERQYDPSGSAAVPYSFNYGQRSRGSRHFKGAMVGVAGVENKKFGKKLRQDWLIIDIEIASKSYLAKLEQRHNPSAKRDASLEIEAAKLARERRQMRLEMARMRKDMQQANMRSASKKTLEERINTLDELKKGALITQEEYDMKRKEILNDI